MKNFFRPAVNGNSLPTMLAPYETKLEQRISNPLERVLCSLGLWNLAGMTTPSIGDLAQVHDLLPVESGAREKLPVQPVFRDVDRVKLVSLLHWAHSRDKEISVLNPGFLSMNRSQWWHKVPVFAVFNTNCKGELYLEFTRGTATAYWRSEELRKVVLPENLFYQYKLAVLAQKTQQEIGIGGLQLSFKFSGIIPGEQKRTIREVSELGVDDVLIVMEVPAGGWAVNRVASIWDIVDPLVVARIGEFYFSVDYFDLTPAEGYVRQEFGTRL